jgi:hypothetical protein
MNGEIKADSKIKTKCPICNEYVEHIFNNVFRLHKANFRNGSPPLCIQCKNNCNSSRAEQEIADYISTFYNSECIRNSIDIISPLELDLYYPEKKTAIEFNGDYWHSDEFKSNDYHYNKFKECKDNNILLVSIFESEWSSRKELVKSYLKDLFNNIENQLSFDDRLMNNNYLHYAINYHMIM